jgi:hypothetical protein
MDSPNSDMDVEAQTVSITETQPAIISNPPPAANAANPQLTTTADTASGHKYQ